MLTTFGRLFKAKLLSPLGFFRLITSVFISGVNLMALLQFAARTHRAKTALVDDFERLTYKELYQQSKQLATSLQADYRIKTGKKVALLCRNHNPLIKAIYALSYLGADVYLLNVEMSDAQFSTLLEQHDFDCIIYDLEVWEMIHQSGFDKTALLSYHLTLTNIDAISKKTAHQDFKAKKGKSGKLVILTGGTTGDFKVAERKPSIFTFLNPFFALIKRLNLGIYPSVFIAPPIYHGFGLASLIISLLLGSKVVTIRRFEVNHAAMVMTKEQAKVVVLVPLMLSRFLQRGKITFIYVRRIISGGAPLNPMLVHQTIDLVGRRLANLYGTSEAGFSIMATPLDLKYHPNTIGRKINGVKIKIFDSDRNVLPAGQIGHLCIKSSWTMSNSKEAWIDTGDLGYVDQKGYFFLCGRIDDMIVSGGENVYPVELENILIQHPRVAECAVIGIPDEEFGQRLKAFVIKRADRELTEEMLQTWLEERSARYQRPKMIEFVEEIPATALGKVDKKALA